MRKLIIGLLALSLLVVPSFAQWRVDDTVAPAGQDANKVQSVQGHTSGTPLPVSMSAPVTVDQPVSVVDDSGNAVANAANQATANASLATLALDATLLATNALLTSIDTDTGNMATDINSLLTLFTAASELIGSAVGTKAVQAGFEDPSGNLSMANVNANGDIQTINVLDGTEWTYRQDFAAAQTDTVVKACPAGKRIDLAYAFITTNASQNFTFQDEDDAAVSPTIYCNGAGSGAVAPPGGRAILWIGATDKDLEIDTLNAVNHGVWASGYIID